MCVCGEGCGIYDNWYITVGCIVILHYVTAVLSLFLDKVCWGGFGLGICYNILVQLVGNWDVG